MTTIEDIFLTPKEVAETLKVTPRTIQRFIENGELEAVKVGRQYRITENALTSYLERNTQYAQEGNSMPETR